MNYPVRPYELPGDISEYHPDSQRPIERWFSMPNSGNSDTIARTIKDLCPANPSVIVDPFCGAGSSGLAARLLQVPFIGIEIDPILSRISTAKTLCTSIHGDQFLHSRGTANQDATALFAFQCLKLVLRLQNVPGGGGLSPADITSDLSLSPAAVPGSQVICGDATNPEIWQRVKETYANVVVFTSPPFYRTWRSVRPWERLHPFDATPGRVVSSSTEPTSDGRDHNLDYCDLVILALRSISTFAVTFTAIIEHEPGDSTGDRVDRVVKRIGIDTEAHVVEVLKTKEFSKGGLLSLIICRLR